MFVIILPVIHEGGNLLLLEGSEQWDFDAPSMLQKSTPDAPSVAWVAFHNDVSHAVLPVVSGARVTLTFNLYLKVIDNVEETMALSNGNLKYGTLKDSLEELVTAHDDDHLFMFGLAHLYPIVKEQVGYRIQELEEHLKGNDALVVAACKELDLTVEVMVWYEVEDSRGSGYLSEEVYKLQHKSETWARFERDRLYEGMFNVYEESAYGDRTWVTPDTRKTTARTQIYNYNTPDQVSTFDGSVCIIAYQKFPGWLKRDDYYGSDSE